MRGITDAGRAMTVGVEGVGPPEGLGAVREPERGCDHPMDEGIPHGRREPRSFS